MPECKFECAVCSKPTESFSDYKIAMDELNKIGWTIYLSCGFYVRCPDCKDVID